MKVALIFNPRSGRGKKKDELLPQVLARLEQAGMDVSVTPTEKMGHAIEIAREAAAARFDRAIAWGGDGTLNEVACGLFETSTALGVLPGGTVNVFAREVGIPLKLDGALDAFVSGHVSRIPLGLAGERPFLLMAGIGLDGEVVFRLKEGFKSALGAKAFWLDGFRLLASYPMTPLRIRTEGREIIGTGLIAGKIRRYGPHYTVTPDAKLEEAKLDVVVFKGTNRRDYLRYLAGVLGHFHLKFADVEHFKTDAVTIDLDNVNVDSGSNVRVQLDGEPAGYAPLVLGVRDKALAVVLPSP
jgi:YegS/Rv2252/BmrU family lipid kinase